MNFRETCIEFNNLSKKKKVSNNGVPLRAVMIYNIICKEKKELSLKDIEHKFYDYYRSIVPNASISRCVNVLKKLGLIFKQEDDMDTRQKIVRLTYNGNQIKHKLILQTGLSNERKNNDWQSNDGTCEEANLTKKAYTRQ